MRDDQIERAKELLAALGPISHRKMFGGAGLYVDGVIFAILIDDEILLKADDALGAELNAAGAERWVYDGKNKPTAMPYWRLPDSAYDDPDEAAEWARKSVSVAMASPKPKSKPKSKKKPAAPRKRAEN